MITKEKITDILQILLQCAELIFCHLFLVVCGYFLLAAAFSKDFYIGFLDRFIPGNISILLYVGTAIVSGIIFNVIFAMGGGSYEFGMAAVPFVLFIVLRGTRIPFWIVGTYIIFVLIGCSSIKKEVRKKRRHYHRKGRPFKEEVRARIGKRIIGKSIMKASCFVGFLMYVSVILCSIGLNIPDKLNVIKLYHVDDRYEADSKILRGETYEYSYDSGNSLWIEHYDELKVLSNEMYPGASFEDRLKALQTLSDLEAAFLGCNPPRVISDDSEQSHAGSVGAYEAGNNTIWLKKERVMEDKSVGCISTVLHEIRHCYQHHCCDVIDMEGLSEKEKCLKMYTDIIRWNYEFENYKNGQTEFEDYLNQYVELDARDYSKQWTPWYYALVNSKEENVFLLNE